MIDTTGRKALLTVLTIVLLITALCVIVGCQKFDDDDIPDLIIETAVDVTEEILDEVTEYHTGIHPEFDFNGNDQD